MSRHNHHRTVRSHGGTRAAADRLLRGTCRVTRSQPTTAHNGEPTGPDKDVPNAWRC